MGDYGTAEIGYLGTATVGIGGKIITVYDGGKYTYKTPKPNIPYLNRKGIPVPLERWEEDDCDEDSLTDEKIKVYS